jgi:dTDP-4-amino-4,6-dideoxygalactose transaminase
MKKIEFFRHNIDSQDKARVVKTLNSIFLTTGDMVDEFEYSFARYLDMRAAIGVTSCTAGLHLSLLAWGINPGDEVITTPLSFCATANAILHAGARPLFVDVEKTTGNIDAERIEGKITSRTKAILPVHLYGQMCDMRKIDRIAQKHGLIVIEDAAHCLEGKRDGISVGQASDAAVFSFYATKSITSGEGGAVATNNLRKAELVRMLRLHGMNRSAADRYTRKYRHWDMPVLGWKYNMDNIQASLLVGQLKKIDNFWERRDSLYRRYEEGLKDIEGVRLLQTAYKSKHARHLFTLLVPPHKRNPLLHTLQKKGVGVAVNYQPIHMLTYYRKRFGYQRGDFPVAEEIGRRTITLPLYPKLKNSELDYIVRLLRKELAKRTY